MTCFKLLCLQYFLSLLLLQQALPSMALESQKAVPQFGCSDCAEKRKKVDMKDEEMREKDEKCLGSKCESKFDLRKSLAWDAAFFSNPGFLEPEELFHSTWDNQNRSAEMKTKANEFNSRNSLAWDKAFLNCEGVLNPVELCLANKGFKKSEMHLLSAIQELRMSSLSTDGDGSSPLATLELQLFEDPQPHDTHAAPKYTHMHEIHTLKQMDGPAQPKMKSLPNPRKQTANQSQKISKEASTTPSSKQCSDGSEFIPSSSSFKPPKSSGRVKSTEMAPTKRISLIAKEVKQDSRHVHVTNGERWIASSKPRSPLKSSGCGSDSNNPLCMKKKYTCISDLVPKSSACRDHRFHHPKGTHPAQGSNSVPFLPSTNLKPSGIRLPTSKIGYFDEGEARSENRSKAVKDRDIRRSSKGCSQHCDDKTKDGIRNDKVRTKTATETQAELCVKGKRPISHKALPRHRLAVTTAIGDSGDVLIELTNQGPQNL